MKISPEKNQSWSSALFLQYGPRLLERCTAVYQNLAALPRQVRRRVQALAGTSLAAVALAIALQLNPVGAAPTAISVNPGSVGIAVDGGCSLTEAILTANDGNTHGDCSGGTASTLDTITLNGNTYTYNYAYASTKNALPIVTDTLVIEGNGATLERGATTNLFRLLEIQNHNLTLNNTAVTGGAVDTNTAGGGIYGYQAAVTINNGTITNNQAVRGGGISTKYGSLTITDSTLSGNSTTGTSSTDGGGAVHSYRSAITVNNSQIMNNTSGASGGGLNGYYAPFTVRDSMISGNTAGDKGGGMNVYKGGLTLEDSMVTQNTTGANRSGGGIYFHGDYGSAQMALTRSHLVGNQSGSLGGGMYSKYGSVTIADSIVTNTGAV